MNNKPKLRAIFILALLIVLGFYLVIPITKLAFKKYDDARLSRFSNRIANTDRMVATYTRSSASLTIIGDDLKRVVQAVSSASSARLRFGTATKCTFDVKAKFFKGASVLGEIRICAPPI